MENVCFGGSENPKYLAVAYKGKVGTPSIKTFVPDRLDTKGAERLFFEGRWTETSVPKITDINNAPASPVICGKIDGNNLNLIYIVAVYESGVRMFVPDAQGTKSLTFEGVWIEKKGNDQILAVRP